MVITLKAKKFFFIQSPAIGIERKWVLCCLRRADVTIKLILCRAADTALLVLPVTTETSNTQWNFTTYTTFRQGKKRVCVLNMFSQQLPSLRVPFSIPVGYHFCPSFLSTCPQLLTGGDRWAVSRQHDQSRQHVYCIFVPLSSYAIYIRRTLNPLHTSTIGWNLGMCKC